MFFVFRHPSRHKNHKRVIPLWVSCAGVLCLPQRRQKVGCKAKCREVLAAASGAGPRQGRPHPGGGGVHPEAPPPTPWATRNLRWGRRVVFHQVEMGENSVRVPSEMTTI